MSLCHQTTRTSQSDGIQNILSIGTYSKPPICGEKRVPSKSQKGVTPLHCITKVQNCPHLTFIFVLCHAVNFLFCLSVNVFIFVCLFVFLSRAPKKCTSLSENYCILMDGFGSSFKAFELVTKFCTISRFVTKYTTEQRMGQPVNVKQSSVLSMTDKKKGCQTRSTGPCGPSAIQHTVNTIFKGIFYLFIHVFALTLSSFEA